jgi:hypothetical protein
VLHRFREPAMQAEGVAAKRMVETEDLPDLPPAVGRANLVGDRARGTIWGVMFIAVAADLDELSAPGVKARSAWFERHTR